MPIWKNPIFRMEIKRFGRLRVWPRGLLILVIASVLGGLHSVFQGWLQRLLFDTLPWNDWSFTAWEFVNNSLNPWRWISIFAVFYLIRAPMRLTEVEEYWVTRLRPRDILVGKMAVMYLFFFVLFNFSFFMSIWVRELYEAYIVVSPFRRSGGLRDLLICIYLNPGYFVYMLVAPAYASIILTSIMLSIKNQARAIMVAMVFYLIFLPFAQDWVVEKTYDYSYRQPGEWRRAFMDNLEWLPETMRSTYYMFTLEYATRSAALIILLTPFAVWLFRRYEKIMLKNFEYRHF